MKRYTIVLQPELEAGGFSVSVPALPGCFTQGDAFEEALGNARDAITLYLEDLKASGEAAPRENQPPLLETVVIG